ncbi:DUF748 domain-containing protein [Thiomicrorhabdus sp. ZW0627]|uniref:DUF748 domain-containing protein n=1 Tax=Thiomicrorhabdus sp. ZW0627 TaxID=3039774 RepID=UPI002436C829|nr:DUF748 domain-containing protein [Thiomicrorhabdus sp. ZW0627]MDG6774541.1 DUF748 domain-containing protein [Thiomicrorhabdus sp. ZW0627]
MFHSLFSLLKRYKWTAAILSVTGLLLILLPFGIQLGIQKALEQQGADEVRIKDVDFNLFTGRLSVKNLEIIDQQHTVLSAKQLNLHWQLRAIWQKHFLLKQLQLKHGYIQVTQTDPKSIQIAGIDIPLSSDKSKTESKAPFILFGLENLDIEDLTMELNRPNHAIKKTSYTLDSLTLSHLYMWDDSPARMILNSYLNQSRIATNFQLHLFSEHPKVVGTLKIDHLNLAKLPYLAEQPDIKASGELTTDLTFTAQLFPRGINFQQQGNILIDDVKAEMAPYQASWDSFNWSGDFSYIESDQDPTITLHGKALLKNFTGEDVEKQLFVQQSLNTDFNIVTLLKPEGVEVTQQGVIQLNDVKATQPGLEANLQQAKWQGEVKYDNLTTPKVSALGQFTLKQAHVANEATKTELTQDLKADLNAQVTMAQDNLTVAQKGGLNISNLSASQPPYQASLQSFDWRGQLDFKQSKEMLIQSSGQVDLKSLQTQDLVSKQNLLDLNHLTIADLSLQQLDAIQLKDLTLKGLEVSKQPKSEFINLHQVHLNQAKLTQLSNLELGTLTLNGSQTNLTINRDGEIVQLKTLLSSLPQSEESKTAQTETTAKNEAEPAEMTEKPAFQYKWQTVQTKGKNQIHFTSEQFSEPLDKTILVDQFKLGALDSRKPAKDTPISLQMSLDEFTKFNSEGQIQPLNPKATANLNTKLDGLDLVALSPVAAQFLGYDIQSGQLSADMETKLVENKIDAQNDLRLHKLELTQAKESSQNESFQKSLNMPIEPALALLKDKQDNIKLKLPIKGDITDPNFNIQDVINIALGKAMKAATKTYLLLALQPFGAIAVAGDYLINQNLSVNLQPIEFTAGQSELTPQMQAYMQKINAMLQERKGVQIKICGLANEADRSALLAQLAKQMAGTDKDKKESKQEQDKQPKRIEDLVSDEQLLKLAEARNVTIKRYLLNLGSANSQVILCQPSLTKDNSAPKVAVGI